MLGDRYVASTAGTSGQRNEYYDTGVEIIESASSPVQRTYIDKSVVVVQTGSSQPQVQYRHLDRLGSLDAVTAPDGSELWHDGHGYDAFGKPRARDWSSSGELMKPPDGTTTERGFTGQEHFDSLYLIHMNGRMYDYRLGRFLSVDPIISHPANTQSLNPYTYIGNNPLSGVDPTGYEAACEGNSGCPAQDQALPPAGAELSTSGVQGERSSGATGQQSTAASGDTDQTGGPGYNWGAPSLNNQLLAQGGQLFAQLEPPIEEVEEKRPEGEGGGKGLQELLDLARIADIKQQMQELGKAPPTELRSPELSTAQRLEYWEGQLVIARSEAAARAARSADATKGPETQARGVMKPAETTIPLKIGFGRAPKSGLPDSIYEQVDAKGNVLSRTFYDANGNSFSRQDFDHGHGGVQPHEHLRDFHPDGRPATKEVVRPVPPGYDQIRSSP